MLKRGTNHTSNQRQLVLSLLRLSLLSLLSSFFGVGGGVVVDDVFVDAFVVPHQHQRHTRHHNRHQPPSTEMMMMMLSSSSSSSLSSSFLNNNNNPFLLLSLNDEFDQILKQKNAAAVDVASIIATGSTITDFVSNGLSFIGYTFLALTVLAIVSGMIMAVASNSILEKIRDDDEFTEQLQQFADLEGGKDSIQESMLQMTKDLLGDDYDENEDGMIIDEVTNLKTGNIPMWISKCMDENDELFVKYPILRDIKKAIQNDNFLKYVALLC